MDWIAFSHYELKFRVDFHTARGAAFQTFFETIMSKGYSRDFRACAPWGNVGDKKNDGYLPSQRVLFQVYAPNELTAVELKKKIEEDFIGALPHWGQDFDRWVFVHNGRALPAPTHLVLNALERSNPGKTLETWGEEELRLEFNKLSSDAKRSIYGPAPTNEAKQNLMMKDLEEALHHIAQSDATETSSFMTVPPGKIEANRLSSSVSSLLKAGMEKAQLVRDYFDGHPDPLYGDRMATSFRVEYVKLRDSEPLLHPDEIFTDLEQWAGRSPTSTPTQQVAILTILAYFFEQCEIFEAPNAPQQP